MYKFWSSFMCTQIVECSGMCICIFVFIFVHTTGAVLCYMSANGKGLNYIPHQTSSLWTSKAAGHRGLAAAVVGKGDHICLWAAVIYFWSLLWYLQHSPGHVCLS